MAIDPRTTPNRYDDDVTTRRDDVTTTRTRYEDDVTTSGRNSGGMALAVLLAIVVIAFAVWMIANDGEGDTTGTTVAPTETTLPVETTVPADTATTLPADTATTVAP